ncbi:hypothetical protein E2C01_077113 [Portunus trituberculatus]|uniref:Uncharacterized protein n=1 Tax=Portunus trituberculatus TaxID=210409 RepID=A0A5B7IJD6_PORTR|nr:hypothetical protein [Portunus trituberculatus]
MSECGRFTEQWQPCMRGVGSW